MPIIEALTLASAVFKATPAPVITKISSALKQGADRVRSRLESSFKHHVIDTINKCSQVQTIFTGDAKVPLKSIYTNLYIGKDWLKIRDDDILKKLDNTGNIVISGTGGAGKTMLMKYLALQAIEYPKGIIPLFIELRNLTDDVTRDFLKLVHSYCSIEREASDFGVFQEGMKLGLFIIFFDGLDEIPANRRDAVFSSIKKLAREFPDVRIIASSRPEIDTRSWGELTTYHVKGLTIEQAKSLIQKVDFPPEPKKEFLNLLDTDFFSKHQSFLSVPLLCSLMLLTFNEYQSIPSRITVFYEQAFETLMRRHDRSKEGYFKRDYESKLSSDRFKAIFSAFCYRTLAKQEISFSDDSLRHHIAKSARAVDFDVDTDKYASDLVITVCVLMRDGLNIHFIHRSFQEYFAALFLLRYKSGDAFELYRRLFLTLNVNDVAIMAADMDIQAFEREWALPACLDLTNYLDDFPPNQRPFALLNHCWHTMRFNENDGKFFSFSWINGRGAHESLTQLEKVYGSEYPHLSIHFAGETNEKTPLKEFLKRYLDSSVVDHAIAEGSDIYKDDDGDDKSDGDRFDDYVDQDDEEREILIKNLGHEWLEKTSMFDRIDKCVSSIYDLTDKLSKRVAERQGIDLLD